MSKKKQTIKSPKIIGNSEQIIKTPKGIGKMEKIYITDLGFLMVKVKFEVPGLHFTTYNLGKAEKVLNTGEIEII